MKIYKYPVPITDSFILEMPLEAKLLSFQMQNDIPSLWAAVWENSSLEDRKFRVVGTGHDIDMDTVKQFIGTIQQMGGRFVWHLFEVKE